ncbi:26S proteasome non-ATPase regulatory subunit 2 [Hondaea fermentalgiana]|uniref:26S proteasome non-ATPase regulatory subunit 2 n=1 Tax=Hondaea fermentalgiana TaxID=2315210 RepID=A0A2R5GRW5_9STRA|nr:26S proteasome non-ATPase regulatory subunit 2 [Hondaea fermentalgiana]|eukprot:GBG33622.1 26S proteasome non-ATPase regulatory subunit 2 [Hondaea fermentalgiana]
MSDPPGYQRPTAKIAVKSKEREEDDEDQEPVPPEQPPVEDDDENENAGLSEEDLLLKETLEAAVAKLTARKSSSSSREAAVDTLATEIRSATSSMTSVPKPLKFLRPHYEPLKEFYRTLKSGSLKKAVADVLSVLAMTMAEEGSRECLGFKLEGNRTELGVWGHEFIRALSGEISQEYVARTTADPPDDPSELIELVDVIIPFQIDQKSEIEAVDLLLEVNELEKLIGYVDKSNYDRVCLYLLRLAEYHIALEDLESALGVAFKLYLGEKDLANALRVAMRLNDMGLATQVMEAAEKMRDGGLVLRQLGLMMGSHKFFGYTSDDDQVNSLIGNEELWDHFQSLARELNAEDPKTPDDVYKSHLSESSSLMREAAQVESARQNLASTYVNAFVNVGFQKDALMTPADTQWLYKNKDHGMISAAASLGMILLWNVNEGMSQIDKYLYSSEFIKAGALLALGIVNCGVRDDVDPALSLLPEHFEEGKPDILRMTAALGLGIAHAGNPKEEVAEVLLPVVADTSAAANMEVVALAGLALGLVFAGTADEDVCTTIVQRLMEASPAELDQPIAKMLCVGLGVLFLGAQEKAEPTVEAVKTVEHKISKFAAVVIETCAYTGTGNVLQVQKLMHLCAEHLDKNGDSVAEVAAAAEAAEEEETEEKTGAAQGGADATAAAAAAAADSKAAEEKEEEQQTEEEREAEKQQAAANAMHQSAAVIGVALITMGEKIGREMAQRTFQHLLQYGDLAVRRAVPLAMALCHISDPEYALIDVLSKLTHDADVPTAMSAIISLGLLGAGTNNSRIAQLLRSLATFYSKDANPLFIVRIAQGLLHAGKGLVTLAPYHSDRTLMSGPAIAGILAVIYCSLDLKNTILAKHHYLLYTLVCAIRPRMLMTLDAKTMEQLPVKVRVGQAVETVGQAGRPKTITGFQTHSTPVLMGFGDRAELVSEEYEPLSDVLEGVVLLKKRKKKRSSKDRDGDVEMAK